MYNLIIADDEYIIRESLASFVDWNKLGFNVVLVAKDGGEVIEFLKERKDIEVILSDIEMKEVSGLEVAKYVFDNRADIRVVIISGYREFEYARKAMSYSVNDYLLKPIDIGKITDAFIKVKAEIDESGIKKQALLHQKNEIENFKRAACENFFELAHLGLFEQEKDICLNLKKFDLYDYLVNLNFHKLSLNIDDMTDYDVLAKDILHNIFFMLAGKHNLRYLPIVMSKSETSYDIIHLSEKTSTANEAELFYIEVVKAIWDVCKIKATIEVRIEKSDLCSFVMKLNSKPVQSDLSGENYLEATAKQYLLILNMTSEIEETSRLLIGIFNHTLGNLSDDIKKAKMENLFNEMDKLIEAQMTSNNKTKPFVIENIESQSPDDYFEKKIKSIYTYLKQDNVYCASTTGSVKKIISNRITENISLQQAADEVFISPNYLSRLFKEETGENFSDYTIRIKMEKAAELLKKSNMKVYEIGEYLGYKSLQYFYKLFKRIYCCTPSEYREQIYMINERD